MIEFNSCSLLKRRIMPDTNEKKQIRIEGITVILNVKDISVSKDFYIGILGFREVDWGNNNLTCIEGDKASIYLCKGDQGCKGTWVWVGFDGDIFSLHDELMAKGVVIRQKPTNFSWALEMHIEDPDGHVLKFGTDPDNNEPFLD